jgi:hypothetical protein
VCGFPEQRPSIIPRRQWPLPMAARSLSRGRMVLSGPTAELRTLLEEIQQTYLAVTAK